MNKKRTWRKWQTIACAFHLSFCLSLLSQQEPSVADLVGKNIQAAGGRDKLVQIKNFSFRAESRQYFIAADGTMKTLMGFKPPVTIEAVSVKGDQSSRNFMNQISEVTGNEKLRLKMIAKLYGGAFTLANFSKILSWQGEKSYGAIKFYCLASTESGMQTTFYIDNNDYFIKRVVFSGSDKESGKFEFIYEYDGYKDVSGIRLPTSLFVTQVGFSGNAVSSRSEISDIVINPQLDPEFYSRLEINAGEVKTEDGGLRGNILHYDSEGKAIFMLINYTPETMIKTGFKSNDRLLLTYGKIEMPIVYYATQDEAINAGVYSNGAAHLTCGGSETRGLFYIFISYPSDAEVTRALQDIQPLLPIEIKKIKQGE